MSAVNGIREYDEMAQNLVKKIQKSEAIGTQVVARRFLNVEPEKRKIKKISPQSVRIAERLFSN